MPLPQKRWYRIADVAKRWNMPLSDIEDYALDEVLQLAVFVVVIRPHDRGRRRARYAGCRRTAQDNLVGVKRSTPPPSTQKRAVRRWLKIQNGCGRPGHA